MVHLSHEPQSEVPSSSLLPTQEQIPVACVLWVERMFDLHHILLGHERFCLTYRCGQDERDVKEVLLNACDV